MSRPFLALAFSNLALATLALATMLSLTACGDKDDADSAAGSAGGCAGLCTDAGFSGGDEVDYGGGLVECTCAGTGGTVLQDACNNYCDGFGVPAEYSYLSSENGPDDKCVCDGTQL